MNIIHIIEYIRSIFRNMINRNIEPMNILLDYNEMTSDMRIYADNLLDEIKRCTQCNSKSFQPRGHSISAQGVKIEMTCGECGSKHATLVSAETYGLFMCDYAITMIRMQEEIVESESYDSITLDIEESSE